MVREFVEKRGGAIVLYGRTGRFFRVQRYPDRPAFPALDGRTPTREVFNAHPDCAAAQLAPFALAQKTS